MNKKLSSIFLNLIIIIIFLIIPFFVFGNEDNSESTNPLNKLKAIGSGVGFSETDENTVFDIVAFIIDLVFSLLALIFLFLTIYSGIRWMTASGVEEEVTKAKKTLKQAIIGLVIVISSWGIWELINNLLIQKIEL